MIEVSVITPTYNRTQFIQRSIACYKAQTYPLINMEWIILDDGEQSAEALFTEAEFDNVPNIRYYREYSKMTIGAKRNKLNSLAKGNIIISWDDDDYYPPERIETIVSTFTAAPPYIQLVGSSLMYMYMPDKTIWSIGPFHKNHSSNATLAYKRSYLRNHEYNNDATKTEEPHFLNHYNETMIQMNPMQSILVMTHNDNTVSKDVSQNAAAKPTTLKLQDFIKQPEIYEMFA
jgi:glycosyltransferase involved in cell wall biosynthesis